MHGVVWLALPTEPAVECPISHMAMTTVGTPHARSSLGVQQ